MFGRVKLLRKLALDNDSKSFREIYKDIKWIKYSSPFENKSLDYYFSSLAYKKDAGGINNYLPKAAYINFLSVYPLSIITL